MVDTAAMVEEYRKGFIAASKAHAEWFHLQFHATVPELRAYAQRRSAEAYQSMRWHQRHYGDWQHMDRIYRDLWK